ncbi:MAG: cation transporter dimerization domain-containing protein [Desulfatirhabdiaceae bacterium]
MIQKSGRRIRISEADLTVDTASLRSAREDMERISIAVVTLPDSAVIWDVAVKTGMEVNKGDRILSYFDRSRLMVDVAMDDSTIALIHAGHPVRIRESLPEILDRSVPDPAQYQTLRILTEHFDDYDGFHGYRTRRSGRDLFIRMTLGFLPETSISEIEKRLRPIRQHMAEQLPGSILTIESEVVDITCLNVKCHPTACMPPPV